jgi:hypothetical protein
VWLLYAENDPANERTKIIETFDTENENSTEQQRIGWQTILDKFKRYLEQH